MGGELLRPDHRVKAATVDDAGIIAFATVIVTLVLGLVTLYVQNRRQARTLNATSDKLGEPNGSGSVAGDVHALAERVHALAVTVGLNNSTMSAKVGELSGVVKEHNRATDARLDRFERSSGENAQRLERIESRLGEH